MAPDNQSQENPSERSGAPHANDASAANRLMVVGIGASAGGNQALEGLFAALPAQPGMVFIAVHHENPAHPVPATA